MADHDDRRDDIPATTDDRSMARRGPDLLLLLCGVVTLLVGAYAVSDGRIWLRNMDPRWIIAGGALVVGLLLLAASTRSGRGR